MLDFSEIRIELPDGPFVYGRYWAAPEPKGAILYHHGIQSHCGWYESSARLLADVGFAVLQVDRRGCGRNEQHRGDAESSEQLLADAHAARDELRTRSGLDDYHVIGISWGGKLAVAAYVDDPVGVASCRASSMRRSASSIYLSAMGIFTPCSAANRRASS